MAEIIFREVEPDEVKIFVRKFGKYIEYYNCFHFGEDCYSLAAYDGSEPVGFISIHTKALIPPLADKTDAYIDAIEVDTYYQRRGIASKMIELSEHWAKERGYRQIRAWSSDDKIKAINMWYALGYCLCPATEGFRPHDSNPPIGYYVAKILSP